VTSQSRAGARASAPAPRSRSVQPE
jgi:hypothetical protein